MTGKLLIPAAIVLAATSCGSRKDTAKGIDLADAPTVVSTPVAVGVNSYAMPKARIYRTSAPSDSLVPITLSPSGSEVTSFPAASDLTSPPLRLADGWLLDRRGITPYSVFTRYTYDQYRALPPTTTPSDLMRAIDRDVVITEIVDLPVGYSRITVEQADSLIRAGLPGCKTILKR